ncbi:MAG: AraC family transcriptional regulator [Verrucomicrobiota bacterium]
MPTAPATTRFLLSLYHTPSEACQAAFYSVVRAGHLQAGPEHHIARESYPGHELILCLKGRGFVRVGGRVCPVNARELAWVNCHYPHEYWSDAEMPWELHWIRFDGPQVERICTLLSIATQPVFSGFDAAAARRVVEEIFELLQTHRPDAPTQIHAAVAKLIALLAESRQTELLEDTTQVPAPLQKPLETMRLYYHKPWRMDELAALAGMSNSHFFRVFKKVMGAAPNEWLRRERITQAKRRLIETNDSVKQVALQCGYADQFYFSRDFKQMTGYTPSEFRRREMGKAAGKVSPPRTTKARPAGRRG